MAKKQETFISNPNPQRDRNPRFGTILLILLGVLISFASFTYSDNARYDDQNYSFRAGYTAGYGHGYADQQSRTNFDFRHDRTYQTESRDSYNNMSQQDLSFRLGYVEGYADGYFHQNPLVDLHHQDQHNGNQDRHNETYDQDYRSHDQGAITVFTGTQFQGYSRSFGIGQYSSLEGRLDDDIESIRVNEGLRVVLFEDNKFKGKSIIIERDAWDLGNFKRKAGSMIIEPIRRY